MNPFPGKETTDTQINMGCNIIQMSVEKNMKHMGHKIILDTLKSKKL